MTNEPGDRPGPEHISIAAVLGEAAAKRLEFLEALFATDNLSQSLEEYGYSYSQYRKWELQERGWVKTEGRRAGKTYEPSSQLEEFMAALDHLVPGDWEDTLYHVFSGDSVKGLGSIGRREDWSQLVVRLEQEYGDPGGVEEPPVEEPRPGPGTQSDAGYEDVKDLLEVEMPIADDGDISRVNSILARNGLEARVSRLKELPGGEYFAIHDSGPWVVESLPREIRRNGAGSVDYAVVEKDGIDSVTASPRADIVGYVSGDRVVYLE